MPGVTATQTYKANPQAFEALKDDRLSIDEQWGHQDGQWYIPDFAAADEAEYAEYETLCEQLNSKQ